MLTTTTIDLLLTLGVNISDLAKKVLDKKASRDEKQQVQELIQRYERIQDLHVQIQSLLEQYYRYVARLVMRQNLDEVYPLCTSDGYRDAQVILDSIRRHGVTHHAPESFELLTVSMEIQRLEAWSLGRVDTSSVQRAKAYTRTEWVTLYSNGARLEHETITGYSLLWQQGSWKIDGDETFRSKEQ